MNKLSQPELWEKIQNFNFDDQNSSYPFSKKLANENNWSNLFTQNAIAEYRKFIFLCCISPCGASPSDIVDKIWLLHLTYTKNYWEDFCSNSLQQDVHHHPSKGSIMKKLYSKTRTISIVQDFWDRQNVERYGNDVLNNFSILTQDKRWIGGDWISSSSFVGISGNGGGGCSS